MDLRARIWYAQWFSRRAAVLVMAISLLIVTGWLLGFEVLTGLPGQVSVKFNSAVCLMLGGLAVWLQLRPTTASVWWFRLASVLAWAVLILGFVSLLEHVFGWDVGIDQLVVMEPPSSRHLYEPGRMTPGSALCFVFIGLALILLNRPSRQDIHPSDVLALGAGAVAFAAVLGYGYHIDLWIGFAKLRAMALPTSILLLVLCIAILSARPDRGLMAFLLHHDLAGHLARRLLLAAIGIPPLLGFLTSIGRRRGFFDAPFEIVLQVIGSMISLSVVALTSVSAVSRSEQDRKRAEALRQEEATRREFERLRLHVVLNALPVGVFICDASGTIREINPAVRAIWGSDALQGDRMKANEVYKAFWTGTNDRLVPEDWGMAKTLATGQPCLNQVLDIESSDGTRRTILNSTVPIRDAEGGLAGGVAVNVDITEHKHTEEELRRLTLELEERVHQRTAELETANHELEAFSYSVSHDLRAPLRWISGFSNAMLEDYADQLPPDARHLLHEVIDSVQRMGRLIDDLLRLSRVTRQEMHLEAVAFSELVQDVAAEVQAGESDRPIDLVIAPRLQVFGDRALLRIVMDNLVRNAGKFTRSQARPRIEVGEQCLPGEQVIFVRDNGAGFDMAYVTKLFHPFERLHSTSEFEGTGIGLAIVKRIVQRHGGRVWAEGAPGAGATFYFSLPARDPIPGGR